MKTLRLIVPALLAGTLLAACGNKGDLVRPDPAADSPATTPATVPAADDDDAGAGAA